MTEYFTEQDWKLFRRKLPGWQEAFMDKLNHEYIALLEDESKEASDKFWALWERIKKDKRLTGVVVEMRRSEMVNNIMNLIYEGAITEDDLADFSDTLRETIHFRLETDKHFYSQE